jgi:hypothetical protein
MPFSEMKQAGLVFLFALIACPALGAGMTPQAIDAAEPSGKAIPGDKPSPLGVRLEVFMSNATTAVASLVAASR